LSKVFTHKWFTTRDDYQHLVRIYVGRNTLINHTEKILGGHVGCDFAARAITTTMQTMYIAAKSGLPEELLQRMQLLEVLAAKPLKLEYDAFAEFHCYFFPN
jgi:hypothetical protein